MHPAFHGFKQHRLPEKETPIHKAVLAYLRRVLPDAIITHVPNGGARDAIAGRHLKEMGATAGWPDLTIVAGGRLYLMEVKGSAGVLSPPQVAMMRRFLAQGVPYTVARSVDDARDALADWNLIRRSQP